MYKRDLYNPDLSLPDQNRYDLIVMADVLEHLPRPDLLLSDCRKYMGKEGRLIASIPNVARFEIRLKLLFGRFDYEPGIISGDHLRFYTRGSSAKLLEDSGYTIERIVPTGLGSKLGILLTLTAFQFVFVCK